MKEKEWGSLELSWVITCSIIAYYITSDIYTPSMPSIVKEFGVSEDLVQMTLVLFMVGSLCSTLISGALAENFGRRRVFVSGQFLAVLSAVVCLFAPNIYVLIGARFFMGLGGAVAIVIGFSAIQDVYSPKESTRIFAVMGSAFAVVPALAPVLGGHLDVLFGWRASFAAIFLCLLSSSLLAYFFFKLPPKGDEVTPSTIREIAQKYKLILSDRKFLRYGLMNSVLISGEWCYLTILPFYFIQVIGVSAPVYGYYLAAMLLCYGGGAYLAQKGIDRFGHDHTLVMSMVVSIVAGFGVVLTHLFYPQSPEMLSAFIGLYLVGQGLSFAPSITKTLESFHKIRASASSVRSSMNATFAMLGALAGSLLNDFTLMPLAIYMIILPVLGIMLFKALKEPAA